MSCSSCGNSNCGGCGSCGSPCNPITQNCPPRCTMSPCPPICNPASPSPYYAGVPTCQENHCNEIITNTFATSICTISQFNIPACDETTSVFFGNVTNLPVGIFLFNVSYGYLEVLAFNAQTGEAVLRNNCETGNAAPGTSVPACTCFVVSGEACCPNLYSDFQQDIGDSVAGTTLDTDGESVTTPIASLSFTNASTTKTLNTMTNVALRMNCTFLGNTVSPTLNVTIETSSNGGAYTTLVGITQNPNTIGTGGTGVTLTIPGIGFVLTQTLPGVTNTLDVRAKATLVSATSSRSVAVINGLIELYSMGFAVD